MLVKFADTMLSVKFELFYHKKTKCRILSVSNLIEIKLLLAMVAFKEVIWICTNSYNSNEYLAMKYIRSFTNNIIGVFNVMFINEQKL